jgi:RHH-type transcriptional regulator, rel operon repressor / antitoxin RelB
MTITVRLSKTLEAKLRARLDGRGVGISDYVREAITEKLDREATSRPTPYEIGKDLFGRHGSGRSDLSTNRKAILGEILRGKRSR